eukprot:103175_1
MYGFEDHMFTHTHTPSDNQMCVFEDQPTHLPTHTHRAACGQDRLPPTHAACVEMCVFEDRPTPSPPSRAACGQMCVFEDRPTPSPPSRAACGQCAFSKIGRPPPTTPVCPNMH